MDAERPRRRSLRLKDYDYSQPGIYFVTICIEGRRCLLGKAAADTIARTGAGEMVAHWWNSLPSRFRGTAPGDHVVMPNHVHGLIEFTESTPAEARPSLGRIVAWFKTMTTNEYFRKVRRSGWPPVDGRLWQRNYYEHIVRDERDLAEIRQYIADNPVRWALDSLYSDS